MGTVIEIRAIIQIVKGKPNLFGHLSLLRYSHFGGRWYIIPIETVDIENFRNPHQGCEVVESIVNK